MVKVLKMKSSHFIQPRCIVSAGEGSTVAPTRAPTRPPPPSPTKSPILTHLEGLMGCGSCIVFEKESGKLPTSTKNKDDIDIRFGGKAASPGSPGSYLGHGLPGSKSPYNTKPPVGGSDRNQPNIGGGGLSKGPGGSSLSIGLKGDKQSFKFKGGAPPSGVRNTQPLTPGNTPGTQQQAEGGSDKGPITSNPPLRGFHGGTSSSQSQAGIENSSKPGIKYSQGLPPGMTIDDLMGLLYKFNYTLKYHGHQESGYRNGDKEGGYFFNGRDGLARNVTYLANEFGYQPNITLVELGLQAPDVPREEKEEPNELRGVEFKWFYKR